MSKRNLVSIFIAIIVGLGAVYLKEPSIKHQGNAPNISLATISGAAKVSDGDTLIITGKRIRLFGIDAPELAQTCEDAQEKNYSCGEKAKAALIQLIANKTVECREQDIDGYGRVVGICEAQNVDLAQRLVMQGWATAYRHYSTNYVSAEDHARSNKNGIWQGAFQNPYEWRKHHHTQ